MASSPSPPLSLGSEGGSDGSFVRQKSAFRGRIEAFEPGRYVLYVCYACPWAHRTIIARRLLGLEDAIAMHPVDPIRDKRGWRFSGGEYTDPVNGWEFLGEAYAATDPSFEGRYSVPVLWDAHEDRIVNNESGDLLEILNEIGDGDLLPAGFEDEIAAIGERVYATVNNGVYRAGFATTQTAYEEAVFPLFATLEWLEALLGERRWLAGTDTPSTADWRLFTTLVRFDAVYHYHFKCNLARIADLPNLWSYARCLYQDFGIADTVRFDEIKAHYYRTHPHINPAGVVPAGPVTDWWLPHDR